MFWLYMGRKTPMAVTHRMTGVPKKLQVKKIAMAIGETVWPNLAHLKMSLVIPY